MHVITSFFEGQSTGSRSRTARASVSEVGQDLETPKCAQRAKLCAEASLYGRSSQFKLQQAASRPLIILTCATRIAVQAIFQGRHACMRANTDLPC